MDCIELSIENLKKENSKLYNIIKKEYDYDCVIFVAKGAYLIGKDLAELNNCPLLEIHAERKGGKFKNIISPFLKFVPKKIRIKLRKKEVNSNYHSENSNRNVFYDESIYKKYSKCKKILLVDDSVDTGNTISSIVNFLKVIFKKSTIKVAAYNVFDSSKDIVTIDYNIYNNYIIIGPWSNDSKEHSKYKKMYNEWHSSMK